MALKFSEEDYQKLNHLFSGGDISICTKTELERFAIMLARPNAFSHFGAASFREICETIRMLILVRMSEEQNKQAKRESRLALIISFVALLLAVIQVIVGLWPVIYPSPTQIEASKPLPIYAPSAISVYSASSAPAAHEPALPGSATPLSTRIAPELSGLSSGASKK